MLCGYTLVALMEVLTNGKLCVGVVFVEAVKGMADTNACMWVEGNGRGFTHTSYGERVGWGFTHSGYGERVGWGIFGAVLAAPGRPFQKLGSRGSWEVSTVQESNFSSWARWDCTCWCLYNFASVPCWWGFCLPSLLTYSSPPQILF